MTNINYSSSRPAAGHFRIAAGSGFAGDRFEPAELLAQHGHVDALVFECLAERTIAVAQELLAAGVSEGYDIRILDRLINTLPQMSKTSGVIISNAGAANPKAAARAIHDRLESWGSEKLAVASVTGDDVLAKLDLKSCQVLGSDQTLDDFRDRIISANAYTGSEPIVEALQQGARVVITGRTADAALFLAPAANHFGWSPTDLDVIAKGTLVGHLLECAGQLTGGYFADGKSKLVPDLWNLGFPMADVSNNGDAIYRKLDGTGGLINRTTVLEQLLYEIDNPGSYVTPDVTVDLRGVKIDELENNVVAVSGATSAGKAELLKVSVGVRDGFLALGEISYSGHAALTRAKMACEIIQKRWTLTHGQSDVDLKFDLVGVNATRPWWPEQEQEPTEVTARFSLRTISKGLAKIFCEEVESLYTNGPFGGGGAIASMKETVGIISTLVPRDLVESKVEILR
jgi:hypothetical protein